MGGTFTTTVSGPWMLNVQDNTKYYTIVPNMPMYTEANQLESASFLFQVRNFGICKPFAATILTFLPPLLVSNR